MTNNKNQLNHKLPKWQYISQGSMPWIHVLYINAVLEAGGRWVQLRLKNFPKKEIIQVSQVVASLCDDYQAIFILNDHVDLVSTVGADGVHLGRKDCSISKAREYLGTEFLIGGTANTQTDISSCIAQGADYIGLGPYRFTTTKEKLSPILGLEGYQSLLHSSPTYRVGSLPIYAIGGIQMADIDPLLDTGVFGVALSGMLSEKLDLKTFFQKSPEQEKILNKNNWEAVYWNWKSSELGNVAFRKLEKGIAAINKILIENLADAYE